MSTYTELYKSVYSEIGSSVTPFPLSGTGMQLSEVLHPTAGEFLEFGFTADSGFTYTCDPIEGAGVGTLTSKSTEIFPLVGDGLPYLIGVLVDSTTDGNFQIGIQVTAV